MTPLTAELRAARTTIEWAREVLDLSDAEIGRVLGADRRSVARWRAEEYAPSSRHRRGMEKLRVLQYLLANVFRTRREAQEWMHSSVPMLRGRTPISLLLEGRLDDVLGVLAGLESGAYA